jgi:prostaglandin-endoperoxide synthase 2
MPGKILDVVLKLATAVAGERGWLNEKINGLLINRLVSAARSRPHPWSTRDPYISWSGLTDRSFSARLLPVAAIQDLPEIGSVSQLFAADATGGQRQCPKSTSLFAAFAQYLTDGFIRTQMENEDAKEDRRRTTSNHEIDLSPLYGRTEAQTRVLRPLDDTDGQRGRLKSQILNGEEYPPFLYDEDGKVMREFLDERGNSILDLPLGVTKPWVKKETLFAVGGDRVNAAPQTSMINTLLLREHNRLAGMIESFNSDWDDEQVFQTARNVLIVIFLKIVVEEYINHINTSPFRLRALPNVCWTANWNRPNWITAEFSLLYRWHSLVPEQMVWNGQAIPGTKLLLDNSILIERGLTNAFVDVSANGATALGLGNTASFLVPFETRAIEQARLLRIDSYNAYRRAMGMKPADSFRDVVGRSANTTEDARRQALADALERRYTSVDRLEFYVGLFAEPRAANGPLPALMTAMVAMDAFSQALTNPLLSEHVWGNDTVREATFTRQGLDAIKGTTSLRDILERNDKHKTLGDRFVGMTRPEWRQR